MNFDYNFYYFLFSFMLAKQTPNQKDKKERGRGKGIFALLRINAFAFISIITALGYFQRKFGFRPKSTKEYLGCEPECWFVVYADPCGVEGA